MKLQINRNLRNVVRVSDKSEKLSDMVTLKIVRFCGNLQQNFNDNPAVLKTRFMVVVVAKTE